MYGQLHPRSRMSRWQMESLLQRMNEAASIYYDDGADYAAIRSLLRFDGESWVDEVAGPTWSLTGSGAISVSDAKFGRGGFVSASNGRIRSTHSSFTSIGIQPVTWSGWVRRDVVGNPSCIHMLGTDNLSSGRVVGLFMGVGYIALYGGAVANAASIASGDTPRVEPPPVLGEWHHLEWSATALVGGQRTFRMFVDGVMQDQRTVSSASFNASGYSLGQGYYTENRNYIGAMDEVRLVVGQVVHTESFSPLTKPYAYNAGGG